MKQLCNLFQLLPTNPHLLQTWLRLCNVSEAKSNLSSPWDTRISGSAALGSTARAPGNAAAAPTDTVSSGLPVEVRHLCKLKLFYFLGNITWTCAVSASESTPEISASRSWTKRMLRCGSVLKIVLQSCSTCHVLISKIGFLRPILWHFQKEGFQSII